MKNIFILVILLLFLTSCNIDKLKNIENNSETIEKLWEQSLQKAILLKSTEKERVILTKQTEIFKEILKGEFAQLNVNLSEKFNSLKNENIALNIKLKELNDEVIKLKSKEIAKIVPVRKTFPVTKAVQTISIKKITSEEDILAREKAEALKKLEAAKKAVQEAALARARTTTRAS